MQIKGYRELDDLNVLLVNQNKELEEKVLRRLDDLFACPDYDKRWLAIGRTHIEQGFMAINRAIMQPQRLKDE